ncbi:hypothetical protein BGX28_002720, partial [Mortierella sp. GBA30]
TLLNMAHNNVPDSDGVLVDYSIFLRTLDTLYGTSHKVHAVETKLSNLKQSGDMTTYIMEFQTLSAHVQWNEAALVARFKEGLSIQVKRGLTNVWNTLTRLADTQSKALMAYQNQEHVKFLGQ